MNLKAGRARVSDSLTVFSAGSCRTIASAQRCASGSSVLMQVRRSNRFHHLGIMSNLAFYTGISNRVKIIAYDRCSNRMRDFRRDILLSIEAPDGKPPSEKIIRGSRFDNGLCLVGGIRSEQAGRAKVTCRLGGREWSSSVEVRDSKKWQTEGKRVAIFLNTAFHRTRSETPAGSVKSLNRAGTRSGRPARTRSSRDVWSIQATSTTL